MSFKSVILAAALVAVLTFAVIGLLRQSNGQGGFQRVPSLELLNVSYDPTRELWRDMNEKFTARYEKEAGQNLTIRQSHGGSTAQARAVIDGLDADVVTLALWSDTDAIRKQGLIKEGWDEKFPHRSLPYFSTIVFVVRK